MKIFVLIFVLEQNYFTLRSLRFEADIFVLLKGRLLHPDGTVLRSALMIKRDVWCQQIRITACVTALDAVGMKQKLMSQ